MELARIAHDVVATRWDNWDLTDFLVYLVDSCASSILPYLADQFNVDGLRGFRVAQTEAEQRELIKSAIAIHKRIGTPWAIKEACRTVGFPIVILEEGVPEFVGGTMQPEDWARFAVYVSTDDSRPVTAEMMQQIRAFINIYKPERCHLQRFGFYQLLEESDRLFRTLPDSGDDFIYDGTWDYDGEITYGMRKREILDIEIVNVVPINYLVVVDNNYKFPVDSTPNAIEYRDVDGLSVIPNSILLSPPSNSSQVSAITNKDWSAE